jgi:hypothetical protein
MLVPAVGLALMLAGFAWGTQRESQRRPSLWHFGARWWGSSHWHMFVGGFALYQATTWASTQQFFASTIFFVPLLAVIFGGARLLRLA